MELFELFKILGNEDRLRILCLALKRNVCLCEIEIILGLSQTTCTKHVKKLVDLKIIDVKKVSLWNEYSINNNFAKNYTQILELLNSKQLYNEDTQRFNFYEMMEYDNLFDRVVTQGVRETFEKDYLNYKNTL